MAEGDGVAAGDLAHNRLCKRGHEGHVYSVDDGGQGDHPEERQAEGVEQDGESPGMDPDHVSGQVDIFEAGDAGEDEVDDIAEQQGPGDGSAKLRDVGGLDGANDTFIEGHKSGETSSRNASFSNIVWMGTKAAIRAPIPTLMMSRPRMVLKMCPESTSPAVFFWAIRPIKAISPEDDGRDLDQLDEELKNLHDITLLTNKL